MYTQLEVGLFDQFFSISFGLYSHLVTHSYCVKMWGELEPQGITLRPSFQSTWTPDPLSNSDIALMEIAVKTYSKKGSSIINRCRMFLQVISIDDLLIPNTGHIHPAYIMGTLPLGHTSKITWPSFPKPPKSYWNLWNHFIRFHLMPIIQCSSNAMEHHIISRFHPSFYKHRSLISLFRLEEGSLAQYNLQRGAKTRSQATYINVPYICDLSFNFEEFFPVDIHCSDAGISIVGHWPNTSDDTFYESDPSLNGALSTLHPALHQTVGNAYFPTDNGLA